MSLVVSSSALPGRRLGRGVVSGVLPSLVTENGGRMSTRFDDEVELAWSLFEAQLEEVLAEIDIRSFSIDVPGETDETGAFPYVQFAGDGRTVRAEVSGNRVLDPAHNMSADQEDSLEALGWQRPTEGEGPNWWCELPGDATEVVLPMVTAAFRQVFGIVHPEFLVSDELGLTDDDVDVVPAEVLVDSERVDVVSSPDSHEDLVAMVTAALAGESGATVHRDSDGDFPFSAGRVPFWIRVQPDKPMVSIFSFMVVSVRNVRQARIEVGLLNRRQDYLRFTLHDGTITATLDLLAAPFVSELFRNMVTMVCEQLDEISIDTAARVGGRLWLDDMEERAAHD